MTGAEGPLFSVGFRVATSLAQRWVRTSEFERLCARLATRFQSTSALGPSDFASWAEDPAFLAAIGGCLGPPYRVNREELAAAITPLVGALDDETPAERFALMVADAIADELRFAKTGDELVRFEAHAVRDALRESSTDRDLGGQWLSTAECVSKGSRRVVECSKPLVGREWVFEWVDECTTSVSSAYLRIVAEAGLGKTALAAAIAKRCSAPAFFFDASANRTSPDQCLNHLAAELVERYELPHSQLPVGGPACADFLWERLDEASKHGTDVVLVIDALDEARSGAGDRASLLLPSELPGGVFVVLTHRPGDYGPTLHPGGSTAQRMLRISPDDPRQQDDVRRYIRDRLARDVGHLSAPRAASRPAAENDLANELQARSEGNFMYLAYVFDDLHQRGGGPAQSQFGLPSGLAGYYAGMWRAISAEADPGRDWALWSTLQRPAIEYLAVAGEPVNLAWLSDHLGRTGPELLRRALTPWERFLQKSESPTKWSLVHQSFRDFLAATEEVDLAAAHRSIADLYLASPDRWTDHEGYAFRHLTAHLRQAGESETLFGLVDSPQWRAGQLLNDPSGRQRVFDLSQAWDSAWELDAAALRAGGHPRHVLRELTCAMSVAELRSFAGELPAELVGRLLTAGKWTPDQALAAVYQSANAVALAMKLGALAPYLPADQRDSVLAEATSIAVSLDSGQHRAAALIALIPELPEHLVAKALVPAARALNHEWTPALSTVAPILPEALLGAALEAALEIEEPSPRAKNLVALLPRLSGQDRDAACLGVRSAVDGSVHPELRAGALAALIRNVPEDGREAAIDDALEAAARISWGFGRARALSALLPSLPGHQRDEICARVLSGLDLSDHFSPEVLRAFAPFLSGELTTRALNDAASVADPSHRFKVFAALLPQLRDEEKARALRQALDASRAIKSAGSRAWAQLRLLPYLPEAERTAALTEILGAARASLNADYPNYPDRARLLTAAAQHLPDQERPAVYAEALEVTSRVAEPRQRVGCVRDLIPHLPEELLGEALGVVAGTVGRDYRAGALGELATRLPDELLDAAVSSLTPSRWPRAATLGAFAPHLPAAQQGRVYADALLATKAISDGKLRARALHDLAPHLPEDFFQDALDAAVSLVDTGARELALAYLAPRLPDALLQQALEVTADIVRSGRWEAAVALANRAPGSLLLTRLADAALGIEEPGRRAETLTRLVPLLPADERPRACIGALKAAQAIDDPFYRARALVDLLPQLTAGQREAACADALLAFPASTHDSASSRFWLLADLAAYLPKAQRDDVLSMASDLIGDIYEAEDRVRALARLAEISEAGQRQAAYQRAASVMNEVTDGYVLANLIRELARRLPGEVLDSALAAVMRIGVADARQRALLELAPLLPVPLLEQAFRQAMALTDANGRMTALVALIPHLSEEQRSVGSAEVLELAATARDGGRDAHPPPVTLLGAHFFIGSGARALLRLAPSLPEEMLPSALAIASALDEPKGRAPVLVALAERMAPKQRASTLGQALDSALSVPDPVGRAALLAKLSDHLPGVSAELAHRHFLLAMRSAASGGDEALAYAAKDFGALLAAVTSR